MRHYKQESWFENRAFRLRNFLLLVGVACLVAIFFGLGFSHPEIETTLIEQELKLPIGPEK